MNKKLHYCVLGLGITGISCLEFLINYKIAKITATDVQDNLELRELSDKYPTVEFIFGELKIPRNADILVLSPGIDQSLPVIQHAVAMGAKLTNDINLFLEQINKIKKTKAIQLAAITGTNGKTTVVNILAKMAERAGIKYAMCGNVGYPVLNALFDSDILLYIIELSSFQLELMDKLYCDVACILNITPDHLDRYPDFSVYCAAKLKIYQHATNIVYYREDINKYNPYSIKNDIKNYVSFGKHPIVTEKDFSIDPDYKWLIQGNHKILLINDLPLTGEHNLLNALACLAVGYLLNLPEDAMCFALRNFSGLDHRCQIVGVFHDGVLWINDSKGTNIGATIAALNNTSATCYNRENNKQIIIILGGVNKNADLSLLKDIVVKNCKVAILIGQCKYELLNILQDNINCDIAMDLRVAVAMAKQLAIKGDTVLFSPACASFDMFKNYKHRGEVFTENVLELYEHE